MAYNTWSAGRADNVNDPATGINTYEWYDRNLLKNAREKFVISGFTAKKTMPKFYGNTAVFSYYENLPTFETPMIEGNPGTSLQLSKVNVRAKMDAYGAFVPFTDDLDIYGEDGATFRKDVTDNLGGAAGETQEKIIFTTAEAGVTPIVFDTTLENTLKVAELSMRKSLAQKFTSMITGSTNYGTTPVRAAYVGFVTPDGTVLLEDVPGYVPVEKYGYSDGLLPNEVGTYRGIRFCETLNMPYDTTNGVEQALILGEECIAEVGIRGKKRIETIIKDLGSAGTNDSLNREGTIGSKFRLAVGVLRPDWGTLVQLQQP